MKKVLLSFAHPDDESFATGLTIPKMVKNKCQVILLCATLGETRKIFPNEDISHREDILKIRKIELESAAKLLGISQIEFLGYQEGKLNQIEFGELEDVIYQKIIEYAPDIVITWDRNGYIFHPDHIKISYATTFAFQKYALDLENIVRNLKSIENKDPEVKVNKFFFRYRFNFKKENFVKAIQQKIEPRLYYSTIPESIVKYLQDNKIINLYSYDQKLIGTSDREISHIIDGDKFHKVKINSLKSYVSQSESFNKFITFQNNPLLKKEFFILKMVGSVEYFFGKNDHIQNSL